MLVQKYIPFTREFVYDYTAIDGKVLGDIEDVLYTWQQKKDDVDNAFLLKRYTVADITINDSLKKITVSILSTDFGNVFDGQSYKEIFSIKYTGDTNFRDFVLKTSKGLDSEIKIDAPWVQLTS